MNRLKHRFLQILIILIQTCVFLVGTYAVIDFASSNHEKHVINFLKTSSALAKHRIQEMVSGTKSNTALIASRTNMRKILLDQELHPKDENITKLEKIINDAVLSTDNIVAIALLNSNDKLIASTNDYYFSNNPPQPNKDIAVIGSGKSIFISRTFKLTHNQIEVGKVITLFSGHFLNQMVYQRHGFGETGEWLVAKRGNNGQAIFITDRLHDHAINSKDEIMQSRSAVPITQALSKNETLMRHAPDYRDTTVMAYTRYIPELDWGLVAKIDEDEIAESFANIKRNVLLLLIPVLLTMIALNLLAIPKPEPKKNIPTKINNFNRKSIHEANTIDSIVKHLPIYYYKAWNGILEKGFIEGKKSKTKTLLISLQLNTVTTDRVEQSSLSCYTFAQSISSIFIESFEFNCEIYINDDYQFFILFYLDKHTSSNSYCDKVEFHFNDIVSRMSNLQHQIEYYASAIDNCSERVSFAESLLEAQHLQSESFNLKNNAIVRNLESSNKHKSSA